MVREGKGGRRGGNSKSHRESASREVTISKSLSYVLRHNAGREKLKMDEAGWACVADLLRWHRIASLGVSFSELEDIVRTNEKQRFTLVPNPNLPPKPDSIPDPSNYLIRAAQGHSFAISSEKLFTPITSDDPTCPPLVVHGTFERAWALILESKCLKPMGRNHIHFNTRMPPRLPPGGKKTSKKSPGQVSDEEQPFSGMRSGATIAIWVDLTASLDAGVQWWWSENRVVLTEGVERDLGGGKTEKVLPLEWVKWVEYRGDRAMGGSRPFENGDVVWGERPEGFCSTEIQKPMGEMENELGAAMNDLKLEGQEQVTEKKS